MTEEITEPAKAVTEVAKTTGKAIDASREFGGWFSQFVEYPLEEASGIIGDTLKYIRQELKDSFQDKSDKKMKGRELQVPTRRVPLKIAIPLVQAATLEEDSNLQDIWANLLINAADKDSGVEVRRNYITILQNLTFFDAMILNKVYSVRHDFQKPIWTYKLPDTVILEAPERGKDIKIPIEEVELSLEVLWQLGVLEPVMYMDGIVPIKSVHHTALGIKFYEACTDKNNK